MMDVGQPDQKRPRLVGPTPGAWQSPDSRELPRPPSLPAASFPPQHQSPFSRPEPQHQLNHRPAELNHYDHQQDPRRPSSGPAHGYHPGQGPPPPPPPSYPAPHSAPPREQMVKRDPSDEPQQPQYRPSSTGNGPEHNVNPPPHHDPRGYLPPFDHSRPQQYQQSYPPPQSPMSATEPYNHPVYGGSGLPPPREPYPSVSYPSSARVTDQVRKKAQRAAQACDSCRNLKAKCDEGRPSCTSCKEKQVPCNYRDPPPKQQDKGTADIMDFLVQFRSSTDARFSLLENEVKECRKTIASYEALLPRVMKQEVEDHVQMPEPYGRPTPVLEQQVPLSEQRLPSNESPFSPPLGLQRPTERLARVSSRPEETSEEDEESGEPIQPKPPSIPVNHTTGAATLLKVGPIKKMFEKLQKTSRIRSDKYPMVQEEKRGLLRLFGRGEGYDTLPYYDKDPLTDHGDSTPGDTHSEVGSPAGEEWGQLGGLTPPGNPPPEISRGGINPEGMPDFSRETVNELVDSYVKNINNMHPLFIPDQIKALVDQFLKSIPESQARPKQVQMIHHQAGFVAFNRNPESPGNKRKRSPGQGEYAEPAVLLDHKPGHPYRSIESALVLLMMALGKICQHKGKIPDVVYDRDDGTWGSPANRNGHPPSPMQSSPSMSTPVGVASPLDGDRMQPRSRRTSIEGPFAVRGTGLKARNIDVIPGLAYFALATDVLGNQLAGNSLQHVHAMILAGLYHGQLGRVMESHGYIAAACRSLQVILRPKLDRFKKFSAIGAGFVLPRDNGLVFAFWTCLQLESDIVAELPCPHSGILTFEEDMPGPNLQAANEAGLDTKIVESYSAQLFLRKHLNQLHNMFYRPDAEIESPYSVVKTKESKFFPTIEASQENLNGIDSYAPRFRWDADKGEPANDILAARIRAKYYGAQVITYRPFILKILELSPVERGEQVSGDFKDSIKVPEIRSIDNIDPQALIYARKAIVALINSTRAFHGLGDPTRDRLIVTNVWGTAHAQWGNVLTLQAAYMNDILKPLVLECISVEDLKDLLEKTMGFLLLVATPASALYSDWRILEYVGQMSKLLPPSPSGPNTNSSFSS